jgi:hypothetical protein
LLLAALMGLHRVYNPGYKWAERAAAELPLAPPDLAARLSNVSRAEPATGVAELRRLIEDTFALVEKHMPEVDTSGPRARFERSRGPASGLPW